MSACSACRRRSVTPPEGAETYRVAGALEDGGCGAVGRGSSSPHAVVSTVAPAMMAARNSFLVIEKHLYESFGDGHACDVWQCSRRDGSSESQQKTAAELQVSDVSSQPKTIAELELTLNDAVEDASTPQDDRELFAAIVRILKDARHSADVMVHRRNIIVLESSKRKRRVSSGQA